MANHNPKPLPPGPGRPKGLPNKMTVAAREAFQLAFEQTGGVKALATWAEENRTEFFKLYGRLIPVDVNAKTDMTGKLVIEWQSKE